MLPLTCRFASPEINAESEQSNSEVPRKPSDFASLHRDLYSL
jgi:hypothetical protein